MDTTHPSIERPAAHGLSQMFHTTARVRKIMFMPLRGPGALLNRHLSNIRLLKQTTIDCHLRFALVGRRPMGHAPASTAAVELKVSVAPAVDHGRVRFGKQAHLVRPIVGPQGAVPPADGAMALVEVCWYRVDVNVDGTTVAGGRSTLRSLWAS